MNPARRAAVALAALLLALLAALPVAVVGASVLSPSVEVWSHLWSTRLPGMIVTTGVLVTVVVGGSLVLGAGLAWLVSAYAFPGARVLGWLLVVPLALPGYVLGFVWLDTLDRSGPLQRAWRAVSGHDGPLPDVRSLPICAVVLILTLYPYVYLLARASFRDQAPALVETARSLGCGPWRSFWRVALPTARPALAAGAALVAMETLTDVGTVRLFNTSTLADGVFRVWFGLGDRGAAAELATLLVAAALAVIAAERWSRGRARYGVAAGRARRSPSRLRGGAAAAATTAAAGVVGVAVGLPAARLVAWAVEAQRRGSTASVAGDLGFHLGNSARLAAVAALSCLAVGVALALARRRSGRLVGAATRLAGVGYAVPGPVVAIGVILVLTWLERTGLVPADVALVGSLAGLVYAVAVRFVAVGQQGAEGALASVAPQHGEGARSLGAGPLRVMARIELPLVRRGLLMAAALVAIDVLKELPSTLLLRPFGFETLPVWIWEATSESRWVEASVPALALVAITTAVVAVVVGLAERGVEIRT